MKRLARRLALVLLGLVLAVVAIEAVIRVFDPLGVSHFRDMQRYLVEFCEHPGPPRILRHPQSSEMRFHGFAIRTNAMALRGAELPAKKAEDEYRVLFLGDSVVLGWGAPLEDTFVVRAEAELNELGSGRTFRCINAGHNQYDTVQEAATLAELGDRLQPDAVLLVYVVNDVEPTIRVWNAFQAQAAAAARDPPGIGTRFMGWLRSEAFVGLNGLAEYLKHAGTPAAPASTPADPPPATDAEGWQRSRDALLRIRDWCEKRKLPFAVLDHTHPGTAEHRGEVPELVPFLEKARIRRHPFHFTVAERKQPIRRSASDAHANRLGHEMLLGKLRPVLRTLGLKTR